jgi:uncharacterized protein (DUF1501 family)
LLVGGAVNGGKIITDWPGLGNSELYAGRDLMPTADLRSLFKSVVADHLHVPQAFIEHAVFPDSSSAKPMRDIIRA